MKKITLLLWGIVFILTAIGIGIVVRRLLIIGGMISATPNPSSGAPAFKNSFNMVPSITMLHVLPGLLFMLLGPLQFMKNIRIRHMRFHRRSGRVFMIAAYIVGLSAFMMPFIMLPVGGLSEAAGSVFFAIFFLVALGKALRHILRKEIALHREWMLRAYAVGLAVATVRPIMALSFAFFGLQPQDFLGTAFWLGFTIHLMVAEVWINYTRNVKPA